MYINLLNYRDLKNVIDRCASAKRDSYRCKLNWSSTMDKLHMHINIYEDILSDHLNIKNSDAELYRLRYKYPGMFSDELKYGEFFNQYYTISNILEGGYEIDDTEVDYKYDYDEYI